VFRVRAFIRISEMSRMAALAIFLVFGSFPSRGLSVLIQRAIQQDAPAAGRTASLRVYSPTFHPRPGKIPRDTTRRLSETPAAAVTPVPALAAPSLRLGRAVFAAERLSPQVCLSLARSRAPPVSLA
jgi:hypothetical protein